MPYSYSGVVKDIQYQIEKQKQRLAYTIPADDGSEEYEKKVKIMTNQIANYQLNIQNDTEVIYNLLFQRDFLLIAINQFLTKSDHHTKQLFINILNKIKADKETDEQHKEKFWRWVNQENFSANLLWEVKNHEKIEHNPILNFPVFS